MRVRVRIRWDVEAGESAVSVANINICLMVIVVINPGIYTE